MKKRKALFPVSHRQLAAYLGISPSLLTMTSSNRYGTRNLASAASRKRAELILAYNEVQKRKAGRTLPKRVEEQLSPDRERLAKTMLANAKLAGSHLPVLQNLLKDMIIKEQADLQWMDTVTLLLSKLTNNKESAKDRIWLEHQHRAILKRLRKNGPVAQVKLKAQIEMESARALIYKQAADQLLKK